MPCTSLSYWAALPFGAEYQWGIQYYNGRSFSSPSLQTICLGLPFTGTLTATPSNASSLPIPRGSTRFEVQYSGLGGFSCPTTGSALSFQWEISRSPTMSSSTLLSSTAVGTSGRSSIDWTPSSGLFYWTVSYADHLFLPCPVQPCSSSTSSAYTVCFYENPAVPILKGPSNSNAAYYRTATNPPNSVAVPLSWSPISSWGWNCAGPQQMLYVVRHLQLLI